MLLGICPDGTMVMRRIANPISARISKFDSWSGRSYQMATIISLTPNEDSLQRIQSYLKDNSALIHEPKTKFGYHIIKIDDIE